MPLSGLLPVAKRKYIPRKTNAAQSCQFNQCAGPQDKPDNLQNFLELGWIEQDICIVPNAEGRLCWRTIKSMLT